MQEASLPGFVRTLLWILAFYYIFKFLARLFFPILVKKAVQRAEEQFKQQHQNQSNSTHYNQENSPKSDKPRETKKVGEYIDYEEIE
jgi:hypothetical protein